MTKSPKKSSITKKKINLGLQGGGAHGAFTWGVLDHLLEDERIDIEGISGTSAGAMNAVMLADGLARRRTCGSAQAALRISWRAGQPRRQPHRSATRRDGPAVRFRSYEGSPVQAWVDAVAHYISPYDVTPLNNQSAARPDRALC